MAGPRIFSPAATVVLALGGMAGICIVACQAPGEVAVVEPATRGEQLFGDDFSADELDLTRWVRTKQHDFSRETVEVVDGRLRMATETLGTDPETVKFHGVRTVEPVVELCGDVRIEFELDWHDQANGCYMRAGMYLCPTASENPRREQQWLRVIYIGVPPGRNARALISQNIAGNEHYMMTENWPEQRQGRRIDRQRVALIFEGSTMEVTENDEVMYSGPRPELGFQNAYVYLQHSSHSNYRLREVFFDDVRIFSGNRSD